MSDACSRTPRCVTHMCSALTTTARPSAAVSASTRSAIWIVISSWICGREVIQSASR